jgi:DNA recombination protein RmuC
VGTLETRVLPAARRFRDLKTVGGDRDIEPLAPLTQDARILTAPELCHPPAPPDAGASGSIAPAPASEQ